MHEYAFDEIALTRHRDGLDLADDHREIIRERAQRGWRLVQVVPFEDHRRARVELIFERPRKS